MTEEIKELPLDDSVARQEILRVEVRVVCVLGLLRLRLLPLLLFSSRL